MLVGKENISRLIERLIAAGADLAKETDDASKLTAFQEAAAEAQTNGLIREGTVQRFGALLQERTNATDKQTVEPAEEPKADDTDQAKDEPAEKSSKNKADVEPASPTHPQSETEPSFAELLDQSSVFDLNQGEYVVQCRLTGAQLLDAYG